MANDSNKMISDFTGKPATQSFFTAIAEYTASLGQATKDTKAQVSFAVNRKFLWLWAYEKTADGVLYLNGRWTGRSMTRTSIRSRGSVRIGGTITSK